MPWQCSVLAYELRISVTGHRTLSDSEGVARAVTHLLGRIDRAMSAECAPLRWTVVSPLAKGADRIVARAVLEHTIGKARLDVIMPFAVDEYRQDFTTPDDRSEFEALFEKATRVQTLKPPESERDVAYLRVGESVVDTSEILIAIWNGEPAAGPGGTAQIIEYAIERGRTVLWINADSPGQQVQIMRSMTTWEPLRATARELSHGYFEQSAYCADGAVDSSRFEAAAQAERARLRSDGAKAGIAEESLRSLEPMINEYVRADDLAQVYRDRQRRSVKGIFYLAASGITAALLQVVFHFARDWRWLILLEILAMFGILTVWIASRFLRWNDKWLHDRLLAERLRTAMYTTLAGAAIPPEDEPHDPLPFYRTPQQWVTAVVASLSHDAAERLRPMPIDAEALKSFLSNAWIGHQHAFHAANATKKRRSAKRRERTGALLFVMTAVMALLHWLPLEVPEVVHDAITFLALALPVWASAIHAVTSQLELERVAERSERMSHVLKTVAHRFHRAKTAEQLRDLADETAKITNIETREWWALLSFQEPRLQA